MKIEQHRLAPDAWVRHFREQANGVRHPTKDGYIFVANQSGRGATTLGSPPPVKLVSPIQQTIDQARSEIQREVRTRGIKRKKLSRAVHSKKKARRGKTSSIAKSKKSKKGKRVPSTKRKKRTNPKKRVPRKKPVKKDIFRR